MTNLTLLSLSFPWAYWAVKYSLSWPKKNVTSSVKYEIKILKTFYNLRLGLMILDERNPSDNIHLIMVSLVIILDMGLLTLNPISSSPKGWKWKISVPITRKTSCRFHPTFISNAIFEGVMSSKTWEHFFRTPCRILFEIGLDVYLFSSKRSSSRRHEHVFPKTLNQS